MTWIQVTAADNIPAREGRTLRVAGLSLALVNTGDRFFAIENRCPHLGGPLADGIIGGTTVTCPLHNWNVCLESGRVVKPCDGEGQQVRTFEVKVENGIVMLALDREQAAA